MLVGSIKEDVIRFSTANTTPEEKEQVAQGQYMWSAIPVALLCMIVNWSKRKQGRGSDGDKVL